jgi:hypothetical protein
MNQNVREKLHQSLLNGLVILTGAGISRPWPSSLPLGQEITQEIAVLLLDHAQLSPIANEDKLAHRFLQRVKSLPMELIWESLVRTVGDGVLHALSIMQASAPNINHVAIAQACEQWRIPVVFTLNFDTLHEHAIAKQTRLNAIVLSTNSEFAQQSSLLEVSHPMVDQLVVAHLHGSVDGGYPYKEISSTVTSAGAGLSYLKRAFLSKTLERWDILCAGYSDQDADVFPQLCRTPNNVYWYTHSGTVTNRINEGMEPIRGRFLVLTREANEANFADILFSISPVLEQACRKAFPMYQEPERESERLQDLKGKLGILKDIIKLSLGSSDKERSYASQLVIATILTELADREEALRVIGPVDSHSLRQPKRLVHREMMIRGEIADRIGDPKSAAKFFRQAKRMATTIVDFIVPEVLGASTSIGRWKRAPFRLDLLAVWFFQLRHALRQNLDVVHSICLWELADFWHYCAEVLLVPSSAQIYRGGPIAPRFLVVYAAIDKLTLVLTRPLRMVLLSKAAHHYIASARQGIRSALDRQPAYTALSLLRLAEVLAAIGKAPQAAYALSRSTFRGDAFYAWVQSGHGSANAICAQAIVAFYAGERSRAVTLLDQAESSFANHQSGIRKARAFRFRAQAW